MTDAEIIAALSMRIRILIYAIDAWRTHYDRWMSDTAHTRIMRNNTELLSREWELMQGMLDDPDACRVQAMMAIEAGRG